MDSEPDFEELGKQINRLVSLCDELVARNDELQSEYDKWITEREELVGKVKSAKVTVSAVLERLKSLERKT